MRWPHLISCINFMWHMPHLHVWHLENNTNHIKWDRLESSSTLTSVLCATTRNLMSLSFMCNYAAPLPTWLQEDGITPHVGISCVAHLNELSHTKKCVLSRKAATSHATHRNESCHIFEWVTELIWLRPVTQSSYEWSLLQCNSTNL